ncbi:unnamed protein product [Brachionus calyciflorus]|uniref:Neurotransmitter-gated ion-channel ligand-binding domain-containing protein n=1 Tax=Brachionus calyciflorus TaxID=104777 RepID=A0A813R7N0_9BILA|nr:unnamed protein product [Brachionus calyciflorus]
MLRTYFFKICILHILLNLIKSQASIEQKISEEILREYDRTITPIGKSEINLTFFLRQLVTIDEKNQLITTNSYVTQQWYDPRLTWNTSDYNITNKIIIQAKKLWLPDLNFLNSADGDGFLKLTDSNLAIVYSDGLVYFIVSSNALRTRCQMNFIKFPYDSQKCDILLGSWVLTDDDFYINNVEIVTSDYVENPNWDLKNLTFDFNYTNFRYLRDNVNYQSKDIVFKFEFKRRALYTMINIILPGFLLNFMTILIYFLELNEQVKIILKIILTSSVYSLRVSNSIPVQSDYMTYVSLYYMFSLVFNLISFTWFTLSYQMKENNIMPRSVELFCVFIRRYLIEFRKIKSQKVASIIKVENIDDDIESKELKFLCECKRKSKENEENIKKKAHIQKCVNVLHYIVIILMFFLMLFTNLALWILITT